MRECDVAWRKKKFHVFSFVFYFFFQINVNNNYMIAGTLSTFFFFFFLFPQLSRQTIKLVCAKRQFEMSIGPQLCDCANDDHNNVSVFLYYGIDCVCFFFCYSPVNNESFSEGSVII